MCYTVCRCGRLDGVESRALPKRRIASDNWVQDAEDINQDTRGVYR